MLGKVFQGFVEKSPVAGMVGGSLERVLNPGRLEELLDGVAERQYPRELLFSPVFDLLKQVVCGVRPSLPAAYQASVAAISVSLRSVYNKLNGVEPETAAALGHYRAHAVPPLLTEMGGGGRGACPGIAPRCSTATVWRGLSSAGRSWGRPRPGRCRAKRGSSLRPPCGWRLPWYPARMGTGRNGP